MKSSPRSPQLEKASAQQWRPNAAKKKKKKKKNSPKRTPWLNRSPPLGNLAVNVRRKGNTQMGVHSRECLTFFVVILFFFLKIDWLIDWLLCWVFVSALGPPPVVASGGHSSSWCAGPSPSWPLLLRSTGPRCTGSAAMAHGPSFSVACGILPDQGSNPRPLH